MKASWRTPPCPWCVLQRLIFLVIACWAVIGLLWGSALGRRVGAAGMLAFAASGVAAATYQHFVASNSLSCGFSLADRIVSGLKLDALIPQVFMPMASCAEAKAILMGMPYEFWSFSLFVLLGLTALRVLWKPTF